MADAVFNKDMAPHRYPYGENIDETPLFMTRLPNDTSENAALEGLKALAYEGTPDEVALNFKAQGNELISENRYLDAKVYYDKSINVRPSVNIEKQCLLNRALCNSHLENYGMVIKDCTRILQIEKDCKKAIWRLVKAYLMLGKTQEAKVYLCQWDSDEFSALKKLLQEKLNEQEEALDNKKSQIRRDLVLKSALETRNITLLLTGEQPDIEGITLESPFDASSSLLIPILVLYPLVLQSDFFPSVDEGLQVGDIIKRILPLPWDSKSEYINPTVYIQGCGNKREIVEKDVVLQTIFGRTVFVDGMLRLYVLPKR